VLPSGAFATGCTYLRIGAFLFAPNNKIVFVAVERTYPAHTPGYISLNTLQISSARVRRSNSKGTPTKVCRKVAEMHRKNLWKAGNRYSGQPSPHMVGTKGRYSV